jgi:hypothetical protein
MGFETLTETLTGLEALGVIRGTGGTGRSFDKGQGWPPPRLIPDEVQDLVIALKHKGRTWPQIAEDLKSRGIANSLGSTIWSVSSLRALAKRPREQPLSTHPEFKKLAQALEIAQQELTQTKALLRECRRKLRQ